MWIRNKYYPCWQDWFDIRSLLCWCRLQGNWDWSHKYSFGWLHYHKYPYFAQNIEFIFPHIKTLYYRNLRKLATSTKSCGAITDWMAILSGAFGNCETGTFFNGVLGCSSTRSKPKKMLEFRAFHLEKCTYRFPKVTTLNKENCSEKCMIN